MESFAHRAHLNGSGLTRRAVDVLQVNLGKTCNQACTHCHVEAGPTRKEMMSRQTVDAVLHFLSRAAIPALDITGGAPELNPHFDYLVESAARLGRHITDRCNLTVIYEPGKDYLLDFFKRHKVELVCSLPCYQQENVDRQRGKGTFDLSIRALQALNQIGYGHANSDLLLNLVYNPVAPHLPPPQEKLEQEYRTKLGSDFGIVFNHLYCLTNVPITRYAMHLKLRGEYESYAKLLADNFNAATLDQVMCRTLVSVGWDGSVYDCDFNQMLNLPIRDAGDQAFNIGSLDLEQLFSRTITMGDHCYACTAGCGSSCGGSLV
jgi:radical SAM/Cys-rich protein